MYPCQDAFFQPYLPLQQIDLLQARSFLVGTTNSIFQQQRDSPIDVIVNVSHNLACFVPLLKQLPLPDRYCFVGDSRPETERSVDPHSSRS